MKNKITAPSRKATASKKSVEDSLYQKVVTILEEARAFSKRAVNSAMVQAYWLVGQAIVEEEQRGKKRADYGERLVEMLSERLTAKYRRGFDKSNLWHMRKFYQTFPNFLDAVRRELSWTHYRLLLKVENPDARAFYESEAAAGVWSTRQLERQINTFSFERIALSKNKRAMLKRSRDEAEPQEALDFIKDPFVLEFLGLRENRDYLESDLEAAILDHLQEFMLELGRGFAFVGRQVRITLDGDHFYIDLDLTIGTVQGAVATWCCEMEHFAETRSLPLPVLFRRVFQCYVVRSIKSSPRVTRCTCRAKPNSPLNCSVKKRGWNRCVGSKSKLSCIRNSSELRIRVRQQQQEAAYERRHNQCRPHSHRRAVPVRHRLSLLQRLHRREGFGP